MNEQPPSPLTPMTARCERCETPLEAGDLRCSICSQAAPVRTQQPEQVDVSILRCTGCGAAVVYDPEHQAPSCGFCGSVFEIEAVEDPMEQSGGFLPFTVDRDAARDALRHWLGTLGWFRPGDLKSSARLKELKRIWWVGWVFDAEALVSWTADSNAGSRRSDWAPHAGRVEMRFDDLIVSASRGLTDDETRTVGPGYYLSSVQEAAEGAEDAVLEQFDVQRSQARREIIAAIEATAASRVEQGHVPGSRTRNVHVAVLLRRLVTRRLSFPAYVLAYGYRERLYRVVICGQDSQRIAGTAPYSLGKGVVVVLGVVAVLAVIIALIGSNL